MTDARIAAEISIHASDLTPADLNELKDRIEEAAAIFKATVTADIHEYQAGA